MICKICFMKVRYDPKTRCYFHIVEGYPELETIAYEVTEEIPSL